MSEHQQGAPPRRPQLTAQGLGAAGAWTLKEGRSDDEPEISNKLAPDATKERLSATPKGSTGSGEGHLRSTDRDQGHAASAGATIKKPPDRRGLIAAALGIGAAALLAKPKAAAADLSFGDVEGAVGSALRSVVRPLLQAIQNILGDIFDFLREIFRFLGLSLPAVIWNILNDILGLIGSAGEASVILDDNVEPALERSYPRDPAAYATPNAIRDVTFMRADDIRARITEAQAINAKVASTTGEIAAQEDAIAAAALASGSAVALLEALVVLQQSANLRIGHVSSQLAAIGALLIDAPAERAAALEQSELKHEGFIAPVDRELSPGGRLPGVPD